MVEFHFVEQGSEQWKIDREGKYTGSNADKLFGRFGATEYAKAINSSFTGNFWTKRGHILEDEAIDIYEQITGSKIWRNEDGVKVGYITNPAYPTCLYSPDGVTNEPLVEVKCFDIPQHLKLIEGDIPVKILAQIHFGLMISERPYMHLIPYNPEIEDDQKAFKILTIQAREDIQANFKRIFQEAAYAA